MVRGPEYTLVPRECTDGQYTCKKTLNITNHQGNAT